MLYIVPTPIGHLEDITLRALRILKEVDVILAEDTRTSRVLLKHYDIKTPLSAYHIHNEHGVLKNIIRDLQWGKNMALISDAGTPGIADPGFLLIRAAIEANVPFDVLPGANAITTALIQSGLPSDTFIFEGFIPHKKGKQTQILSWKTEKRTIIFYESPHRIRKTLQDLATHLGEDRKIVVARELTKMFQEVVRGTISEVIAHFQAKEPRGEFVVLLARNK
jgi:16S rRNA (cytidine1402-2'-O)-methyltransferase